MKKKEKMRELRVIARGMVPLANGEAAQCGEALLAQNVREQESSLQVTGQPAVTGTIAVGERLLLLADEHKVTCRGRSVKLDGVPVVTVGGNIVGAHALGDLIVIVADTGLTYLKQHEGAWRVLNPADAVPQLSIGTDEAIVSTAIDAYTFAEPYACRCRLCRPEGPIAVGMVVTDRRRACRGALSRSDAGTLGGAAT